MLNGDFDKLFENTSQESERFQKINEEEELELPNINL